MYTHLSISDLRSKLACGELTCSNIVETYLSSIEHQSHLNAFVEVFAAEARSRAQELDQKLSNPSSWGKCYGVVVGIKDVLCYKNHHVGASSAILQQYTAIYNATAIQRLLDEDAIIIGNLNCDEFAMGSSNEHSVHGKVLNALDNTRVPGGSSGGSAVAVQAKMCMVSLGSDTGGSVRQPADFCGIIGLKPSYGRISRHGLIAYASSFDQVGIFASTIEDAAIILETIAGEDQYDSTCSTLKVPAYAEKLTLNTPLKIAYFPQALEHPSLDPEIRNAIYNQIEKIKNDGHTVSPCDFEYLDYIVPAYYILTTAEASSNLSRYDGIKFGYRTKQEVKDLNELYMLTRSEGFGKEVKRRIMLGTFVLSTGYYDAYYTKAQQVRRLIVDKTKTIFSEFDLLIIPTTPSTAFRFGEKSNDAVEMFLGDLYTVYANLAGCAGISIPLFTHSNGMPFGMQVITDITKEETLLAFSSYCLSIK